MLRKDCWLIFPNWCTNVLCCGQLSLGSNSKGEFFTFSKREQSFSDLGLGDEYKREINAIEKLLGEDSGRRPSIITTKSIAQETPISNILQRHDTGISQTSVASSDVEAMQEFQDELDFVDDMAAKENESIN